MKYVLIVGDGMADLPIESLDNRTPLEAVGQKAMARVGGGRLGRVRTCPEGLPPGSDVAFLTLLGHDPLQCYRGRSPLEAAAEQVRLKEDEVSFRMNLVSISGDYGSGRMSSYNGDGIDGEDALTLVRALLRDSAFAALLEQAEMTITPTDTFRHVAVTKASSEAFELTPPHDIAGQRISGHLPRGQKSAALRALQETAWSILSAHPVNKRRKERGQLPANGVWFWGAGRATILESFPEKYGRSGAAVSAVPLVKGIAWLSGLSAPAVEKATGTLDTNYQGKVAATLQALQKNDFALLHLEAPDDLSHLGDIEGKVESIRRLDEYLVGPVMEGLSQAGEDYRILLMPDHYTLLSTQTHDGTPAPFALYDSRQPGTPRPFTEAACAQEPVLESGDQLMRLLFEMEQE